MLDARGYANLGQLLSAEQCEALTALFPGEAPFRSHIIMRQHGFGEGEYKYFSYPLPPVIARLRNSLYSQLVPVANRWQEQMRSGIRFPETHSELLTRCHRDDQTRPTPLMLKYCQGDFKGCARYRVEAKLGSPSVPPNLFPQDASTADRIVAGS